MTPDLQQTLSEFIIAWADAAEAALRDQSPVKQAEARVMTAMVVDLGKRFSGILAGHERLGGSPEFRHRAGPAARLLEILKSEQVRLQGAELTASEAQQIKDACSELTLRALSRARARP